MMPILYDTNEVYFTSNGLGRLRDCISCTVTEERNGIYECDFEYPVRGAQYDKIKLGRIIGVTHDDMGDVQPFDIVSISKPIDGVVTFHCVHISYRQSYLVVRGSNINTLESAFTLLESAKPTNPFVYWTDKVSAGYMASADGIPRTVKQLLGGVEGSILDAYGGEYEWDKFTVKLWEQRGRTRDFTIRYGVNMLDYIDEMDMQGTYSSCVPYWSSDGTIVVGGRVISQSNTLTKRDECVPLDLTDKFENAPTASQLENLAQSMINNNNTYLPTQNIKVSFIRLQDTEEYSDIEILLQCNLCDTVRVIFPDYGTEGQFKIVKTTWNVLFDRYDSMELGNLSTTLAEALGISEASVSSGGEGESDVLFVTATGVAATVGAMSTQVFDTNIDTQTYIDMGYTYQGFIPASTGDFLFVGTRLSGTIIRLSVFNSYSAAQTPTVGGVAVFSK